MTIKILNKVSFYQACFRLFSFKIIQIIIKKLS
jgi:hypothetical protein